MTKTLTFFTHLKKLRFIGWTLLAAIFLYGLLLSGFIPSQIGNAATDQNLIAYWPLDEGTGSTISDAVGNLDGVFVNMNPSSVWVGGQDGTALKFDGSNDQVSIPNFTPPQTGTMTFWIRPDSVSGRQRVLGGVDAFEILLENGKIRNQLFAGGSADLTSSMSLSADVWYHIGVTYDFANSNELEIFINGEFDNDRSNANDNPGGPFTLALGNRNGSSNNYGGILEDVRLYDRVLSEAEIAATMMTTEPEPDTEAPTVPNNLDATVLSETAIELSWDASTDDIGVTGYNVYRDSAFVTTVSGTSYTDNGLQNSTTYTYEVSALDAAGNESNLSDDVAATTNSGPQPDTEAPIVPSNLNATVLSSTAVELTWNASTDNISVAGYNVLQDGAEIDTTNSLSYVVTGLTEATTYSFAVNAFDAAGNESNDSLPASATTNESTSANEAPVVSAGSNQSMTLPTTVATLDGMVADDNPASVSTVWSQVSGPGTVVFGNALDTDTIATLPAAGTYVLRLTANDGEFVVTSDLQVTIEAANNQAPLVSAGSNQNITLPTATAQLDGTAFDPDSAANPIVVWSQVSGPGSAVFADPTLTNTTATFPTAGTYVLRLTAGDGAANASSQVTITIEEESVTNPPNPNGNQLVVNPANPAWLYYENGDPFFMAGPGDPEGFLYRGTRNADGTRSGDQMALINKLAGTGANAIYLMAVRSNGGDGGPTENPFINSDPSQGLDEDILNQWDTWFTEMDEQGIVTFFFFYDDSTRIWNTGDTVGNEERAFIQDIVNRFEHHEHLIWVVAEEYEERYSAARVSNIAREIKLADDFDHPVAVHKLSDLAFTEFANDPNIDQFAVQWNPCGSNASCLNQAMLDAWDNANGQYNVNMSEAAGIGSGTQLRQASWAMAMGGAYVMILGMDIDSTPVSDLETLGRLRTFMEGTDFDTMAPSNQLALDDTDYVLANPGTSYIAYSRNLISNMGVESMSAGTYDLVWLDTETGTTVAQTVTRPAGDQSFVKPGSIGTEAALYIKKQ